LRRLVICATALLPGGSTQKPNALLHTSFCSIRAMPVSEPAATVATTCVSLQLTTWPAVLPSQTTPLPGENPKPPPVNVT